MKYIKVKTALNVDKDEAVRFKKFAKDLEKLSEEYGIIIKSIGGVEIFDKSAINKVRYSDDPTSGDLLPHIIFNKY